MNEWDGFNTEKSTAYPIGRLPTHTALYCFAVYVAGGDDGGLFLLSSAMVGYLLRTLDSLRNYVRTNMGKITSIYSFICLFSFGFATTRINGRKTREPIGMIIDEFIRCMHTEYMLWLCQLAARLMISYPSMTVMPINVPTEREYEQKPKTPV